MYEFWNNLVLYFDDIFGLGLLNSQLVLIIIIILIFVLIFGAIFVHLLKGKLSKNKQKLIYEYDNIFYIISGYNYQTGTSDSLDIINKIFKNKNLSYISNHKLIVDAIQKIETEFGKKIIPSENWFRIKRFEKKIKFCSFLARILKVIILFVIVLFMVGLYYVKY